MGLADIARAGVAIADRLTGGEGGLQVTVSHRAWQSQDGDGKPTHAPTPVSRSGFLKYETASVRSIDGHERKSSARLTFLGDVPVDERDLITLPDGRTPPIVHVGAPADAGSPGAVFATAVYFGVL